MMIQITKSEGWFFFGIPSLPKSDCMLCLCCLPLFLLFSFGIGDKYNHFFLLCGLQIVLKIVVGVTLMIWRMRMILIEICVALCFRCQSIGISPWDARILKNKIKIVRLA